MKVPSVKVQALLAFSLVQQWVSIGEGQSTGSGTWTPFICNRENNAILFTIKIGNCNIIPSGLPCFMDLINRMVLQGVCSSNDVDFYVCNINSSYTGDPPCCVSHLNDGRTSNSCESSSTTEAVSIQGTTDPIGQDTSPTASTVPNLNSTADIPDPPMKDNNGELSLENGLIIVAAVIVVVVGGGCGAARRIVRQRVPKEDTANPLVHEEDTANPLVREEDAVIPPEHVEINNVAQDEREVPPDEAETRPYYSCPVQERVRGDQAPGSATHRGSQNSDQSGVYKWQPEFPSSFSNQMGKPEENGNSNANPHHVCVELPSTVLDTPDHSHGTQPKDGFSTSEFVYTQPMQNKPLVECGTGVVVYGGASQASSLGSSDEAI